MKLSNCFEQTSNFSVSCALRLSALVAAFYGIFLWALSKFFLKSEFDGSPSYGRAATQFLRDGFFDSDYRPPLYPLFLAGCMKIFGESWEQGAIFIQIIVAMSCCAATIYIACRISNSCRAGIVALVVGLLALPFHLEMVKQRETFLYVFICYLLLLTAFSMKRGVAKAFLIGILAGATHLIRPDFVALFAFLGFILWLDKQPGEKSRSWTSNFGYFALSSILFCLTILPWQLRVYELSGKITLSSSNTGGVNLWKGNNPNLFDFYPGMEVDNIEPYMREVVGGSLENPGANTILSKLAVEYIKSEPLAFIGRSLLKSLVVFSPLPLPYATGTLEYKDGQVLITSRKAINPGLLISYTVFSLLSFYGVFLAVRFRAKLDRFGKSLLLLAAAMLLLRIGLYSLLFFETRFRLPMDPFLVFFAAFGYYQWYNSRKSVTAIRRF